MSAVAPAAPVYDDALIRKYDMAGPRYTSYPTAPHFHAGFDGAAFAEAVREAASGEPRDLSLYFHLPFCRRVCYFCACNVTFTNDRERGRGYNQLLMAEMDRVRALPGDRGRVRQLHWGGGTPTFSAPDILEELIDATRERFRFAPDAEVSVEADPRETTGAHLEMLARHGFNRLSLGIQDFDPAVQRAVNRIQPLERTRDAIAEARRQGFASVNVDLIYGLPRQSLATFQNTVDRLLELQPDRVALFNFAYLPEMVRHQRVLKPEELPAPATKLSILKWTSQRFIDAGYVFIGMDHFARPGDELTRSLNDRTLYRNFQGYTTRAGLDLYGFGVTAIGQIGRSYAQNLKDLTAYTGAIEAGRHPTMRGIRLTDDDLLRRDVIFALMCHFVVVKAEIAAAHAIRFDDYFAPEMEALCSLEADGLVHLSPERIEVCPPGRFLVRNVAMIFDAYLNSGPARSYSRTV